MTRHFCSILALSAALVSFTAPASALPQVELRGANSELTQIGIEPRLPATQFLTPKSGLRAPLPVSTRAEADLIAFAQDVEPAREAGARVHLGLYTERAKQTGKLEDIALTANYTISW